MQLRDYQNKGNSEVYAQWGAGHRNVLLVNPTGSGKTVQFSKIISEHQGAVCAIAHRSELVGQMSTTLARYGIYHKVVAPKSTIRKVTSRHCRYLGKGFVRPESTIGVASVDTLLRRADKLSSWLSSVSLWVLDEGHHLLDENKWGKVISRMPNAWGLGVTADTERADGKGLGRHHDGLYDSMVIGPSGRDLIDMGYLKDYRVFAPPSDFKRENVPISKSTGDFIESKLKLEIRRSTVLGDVVEHYAKFARGARGITFAESIQSACDIADKFNGAGIPAQVVSSKTDTSVRDDATRRLEEGRLLQLVNVDIFGEGFDLPTIVCVSMARATESFQLFKQQFGRGLRPTETGEKAIIIDHVGNVARFAATHGLPDSPRDYTLDRRTRRSKRDPNVDPMKICLECTGMYAAYNKACPYCGYILEPAERSRPEHVDGDLTELSQEVLQALRVDVSKIDTPYQTFQDRLSRNMTDAGKIINMTKAHKERQLAQLELRGSIALWAGWQDYCKRPESESYRRFYHKFGMDVLSAQTLGRPDAEKLNTKIKKEIDRYGRGTA